jgi:hypothetical protein
LLNEVTADQVAEQGVAPQQSPAVLNDLPQQGLRRGGQVDQVNGPARGLSQGLCERYFLGHREWTVCGHRKIKVTVGSGLTCGNRPKEYGKRQATKARQDGFDLGVDQMGFNVFHNRG